MTELTEEKLTEIARSLHANARALNPYVIVVPPQLFVTAGRMLHLKPPIRKVSGARKRKRALHWRKS